MTEEKIIKCFGGERQRGEFRLRMGLEFYKRLEPIAKYLDRCHKQYANFPHRYLSTIGVDPVYQGRGYASLLIRAKLAELDKQTVPCYLETMKEKNVSIYQHFGFEVVEDGTIPDTDIPMWAMLRKIE